MSHTLAESNANKTLIYLNLDFMPGMDFNDSKSFSLKTEASPLYAVPGSFIVLANVRATGSDSESIDSSPMNSITSSKSFGGK